MRTGLIGADALGAVHVVNLVAATPECRMSAVASERISPVALQAVRSTSAETGGAEELLDPGHADAVVTATPVEKPLPRTSVEASLCGRGADADLLDDRLTAIRRGSVPPVPREDGWKAIQVAPAALTSTEDGTVIDVTQQEVTQA